MNDMKYTEALKIAEGVREQLRPHCYRCEIAGSIRRKKEEVTDIDIVAIPKPYDIGLLEYGITTVVKQWKKIKGDLPGKNTRRMLPDGIELDLYLPNKNNWGWIFTQRTGDINYNKYLLRMMGRKNLKCVDGHITRDGIIVPVFEEEDFYRLIGVTYIKPEHRRYD